MSPMSPMMSLKYQTLTLMKVLLMMTLIRKRMLMSRMMMMKMISSTKMPLKKTMQRLMTKMPQLQLPLSNQKRRNRKKLHREPCT